MRMRMGRGWWFLAITSFGIGAALAAKTDQGARAEAATSGQGGTTEAGFAGEGASAAGDPMRSSLIEGVGTSEAARLISESAHVKQGDIVVIQGGSSDVELLQDLAADAREMGGSPLVLLSTVNVEQQPPVRTSADFAAQEGKAGLVLAGLMDVYIAVAPGEDVAPGEGEPSGAGQALGEASMHEAAVAAMLQAARDRGVRTVVVRNGEVEVDGTLVTKAVS